MLGENLLDDHAVLERIRIMKVNQLVSHHLLDRLLQIWVKLIQRYVLSDRIKTNQVKHDVNTLRKVIKWERKAQQPKRNVQSEHLLEHMVILCVKNVRQVITVMRLACIFRINAITERIKMKLGKPRANVLLLGIMYRGEVKRNKRDVDRICFRIVLSRTDVFRVLWVR